MNYKTVLVLYCRQGSVIANFNLHMIYGEDESVPSDDDIKNTLATSDTLRDIGKSITFVTEQTAYAMSPSTRYF